MPVYISEKAHALLKNEFPDKILVKKAAPVYTAIEAHPDIYMCRLPDGRVFKAKSGEIGGAYPRNIPFNALCLDKYFVHNLKYTNERLLKCAEEYGLLPVNVKQGYTKCSCVAVDGKSVITADEGIYSELSALGDVDVLKIHPGYVALQGFEYGFLGGASGRVGDTVYFSGDITQHPDYDEINAFIRERGLGIKAFPYPLEDIGSIIEELI